MHILVESADELAKELARLEGDVIGVDVERADANNYYRRAALIQVGNAARCVLIDSVALPEVPELDAFLSDRLTVLHAVENDIGPLLTAQVDPPSIADTGVAAALLGLPTGLDPLLTEILDESLTDDKEKFQRADWSQRPLPEDMLAYAAGDVYFLPALWEELEARLDEAGRRSWYDQELEATLENALQDTREWWRTKGAGRLDQQQREALRHVWEAREEIAKENDLAPQRVLRDPVLLDIVKTPATSARDIVRRNQRRKRPAADHAEALMDALEDGLDADPQPREPSGRRPSTSDDRDVVDALRKARSAVAKDIGIDAGVVCPSRVLMPAVTSDPTNPDELIMAAGLRPWQAELLADPLWEAYVEATS